MKYYITVFLILVGLPTFGQGLVQYSSSIENYRITNLGSDEGIHGIQVHDLYQDKQGFLWLISTIEVLKYDGINLRTYSNGFVGGTLYEINVDRNGEFIMPSFGVGTYLFSEDSLRIAPWKTSESVKSIELITKDSLFIGSYGDGVFVVKNDSIVNRITTEEGLVNNNVWKLHRDINGAIWVATNGGLSIIQGSNITNYSNSEGFPDSPIRAVQEMLNGDMWIGTDGGGIVVFRDYKIHEIITAADGLKNNFIYTITQNPSDSTIWIGHQGDGGITRLSESGSEFYTTDDGLISNQINKILFLKQGEIAIATEAGLSFLSPKKIDMVSIPEEGILSFETVLVKQDSSQKIWFGSYSNGFRTFDGEKWQSFESPPEKTNGYTQSATVHKNGAVWFGTQGSGIIEVRQDKITRQITMKDGLLDDYVRGIEFDEEGNLWVCTNNGINKLNLDFEVVESFSEEHLPNPFCTDIVVSKKDGSIWAGSFGGGAVHITPDSIIVFNTENGLKSDQVISVYEDSNQHIWIGTLNHGLTRITGEQSIIFDENSGLPQANYAGFVEDLDGNFWIATGNGIIRTRLKFIQDYLDGELTKVPFQLYVQQDGMLIDNMQTANNATIEVLKNGDILFATSSGVVVINPQKSDFSNSDFFPYIERITANGRTLDSNQSIILSPKETKVSIDFSALNFSAPHKTKFRIKLSDLDTDWDFYDQRTTAYYDYLPAGNYTFSVSAAGPDGQWSDRTAEISFVVLPPFYKTWWFYSLSVIAFGGFIAGLMQLRTNVKMKALNREMQYQQKLHAEKERISRDLHDNVGSQITNLITGIEISNLHIKKSQHQQAEEILSSLDIDARNTMTDLRETIWLMDKTHVEFEQFVNHLKGYVKRQQHYLKGLKVEVLSSVSPDLVLNPTQSLNLMRIIQEALNNARKYSEATHFSISFAKEGDSLTIELKDNGIGMDTTSAKVNTGGNGINNMRSRTELIAGEFNLHSELNIGTTISLSLPLYPE